MKKLAQKYYKILGLLIIMAIYFSWCFLTVSYRNSLFFVVSFLCIILSWYLYVIMYLEVMKDLDSNKCWQQLFVINDFIVVLGIVLAVSMFREPKLDNTIIAIQSVGWSLVTFFLKNYSRKHFLNQKCGMGIGTITKFIKKNMGIIVLLIVVGGLSYDPMWEQFKWDGLLYFQTNHNLNLASISSLAIYGHIAQTYGVLVKIVSLIIGNVALAMLWMNVLLLLISVCAFYGIIKLILPEKTESIYIFATAVFAFAPLNLGMVNYHNLDFYLQCLFPIVVYFTLKKQWVFECIAAILFCFTKEPAIVIYGCFCVGVVGADIICYDKNRFWSRIKSIFTKVHYYYMAIPGLLWIITYKMLGPWSAGEGGLKLDYIYILEKLKTMYILNFNWLFSLLFLVVIVGVLIKRIEVRNEMFWVLPIIFGQVAFTGFSCIFKTVNHPRYLDSTFFSICLLGIVFFIKMCREKMNFILLSSFLFLMIISSYWTIDPISKYMFKTVDIGSTEMITTGDAILGDAMIYNKQMLGLENVMNQAIEVALEMDTEILIPAIGDSTYFFDGMSEVLSVNENVVKQSQYWDKIERKRVPFYSENVIVYDLYHLNGKGHIKEIEELKNKVISYIYIDSMDKEYTEKVLRQIKIKEEYVFEYKGWKLNLVIGEV